MATKPVPEKYWLGWAAKHIAGTAPVSIKNMARHNNYKRPSQSSLRQVFVNFSSGVEPLFNSNFIFIIMRLMDLQSLSSKANQVNFAYIYQIEHMVSYVACNKLSLYCGHIVHRGIGE